MERKKAEGQKTHSVFSGLQQKLFSIAVENQEKLDMFKYRSIYRAAAWWKIKKTLR